MKIYHYTSIESLALILKNKTIRFNRLDYVDDMEEAMYPSGSYNTHIGQYAFVTCWTKTDKENIAMWKMYTNGKGVRIGLDADMFPEYSYFNKKCLMSGLAIEIKNNHFTSCLFNEYKLYDVKYVEDVKEKISQVVETNEKTMKINTSELGLYKNKAWSFQDECRYRLVYLPIDKKLMKKSTNGDLRSDLIELIKTMAPLVLSNKALEMAYVDLPLKEGKLKKIEVVMGPLSSEGEKAIVEHLLKDYPESSLLESYSKGKIRM